MAKTIFVEIVANASQFKKELNSAVGSTNKANSGFARMGAAAKLAGVSIATGLAVALEKSVVAAIDAQNSQRRLETAFQRVHISMLPLTGTIKKVEAASRKLGFTDTETKDSLGSLILATHSYKKAAEAMGLAQDIARFKGVDLTTATKTLTLAQTGSQRALKQLGLTIQPVTDAQDRAKEAYKNATAALKAQEGAIKNETSAQHDRFLTLQNNLALTYESNKAYAKSLDVQANTAAITKELTKAIGGQAEAFSKTSSGGMARFHAELDHLQVMIGNQLLPILGRLLDRIDNLASDFNQNLAPGLRKAAEMFTRLHGEAALMYTLFLPIKEMLFVWKLEFKAVGLAVEGVTAAINACKTAVSAISSAFTTAWNAIRNITSIAVKDVANLWSALPGKIGVAIESGANELKKAVTGLFGKVIGWIKEVFGIKSPSSVFEEIGKNVILGFIKGIGNASGMLKDYVTKIASSLLPDLGQSGTGGIRPPPGTAPSSGGSNQAIGRQLAGHYGWGSGGNWAALVALWNQESGWNNFAKNKSSGAYGIPQALPESKLPPAGRQAGGSDPGAQISWGLSYIHGRYGSPLAAWAHEQQYNWYDKGGWLPTGLSLAMNNTGRPEMVLPPGGGGGMSVVVNVAGSVTTERQLVDTIRNAIKQAGNRNGGNMFGGAA